MSLLAAVAGSLSGGPVTANVNSTTATGTCANGTNQTSTASSTATAYGGSLPYTYAWQYVSGSAAITPASSSSATTAWRATGSDEAHSAVYRCLVTDVLSATDYTENVTINITQGTPP